MLDFSAETSNRAVATVSVSGSAATIRGVGKGIAVITVTATDPEGLSARQNFNATVPNRPPFVRDPLPAVEVKPADSATVNLAVYFDDPDGDSLIFSTETSDEAVASASVSGSVMTVAGIAKGKAEITVTAADPDGLAVGQTFDVDVPNQPPVIRDSIPALEMNPGDSATVDLAAHLSHPSGSVPCASRFPSWRMRRPFCGSSLRPRMLAIRRFRPSWPGSTWTGKRPM